MDLDVMWTTLTYMRTYTGVCVCVCVCVCLRIDWILSN
jgi:hypothetical protein